jgi:hypothetical protein
MENPNVHPGTLPCGCRPGYYLCMEAEDLWREAGRAYDRTKHYEHGTDEEKQAWREYIGARTQYDMHFEGVE